MDNVFKQSVKLPMQDNDCGIIGRQFETTHELTKFKNRKTILSLAFKQTYVHLCYTS